MIPPPLAMDLETRLIVPGNLQPEPIIASFCVGRERWLEYPSNTPLVVQKQLINGGELIGHNIYFDLGVLVKYAPRLLLEPVFKAFREGRIRDTKTRQQIIDISKGQLNQPRNDGTQGYTLAELELHHLGLDRSDEKNSEEAWRLRYQELEKVPLVRWPDAAKKYALDDAEGPLKIFEEQKRYYIDGFLPGEAEITRSNWALHLSSCHGIFTDHARVEELKKRCNERREDDYNLLRTAGLIRSNGTKDLALIRDFVKQAYEVKGRKVPKTAKGAVATDRDTLEQAGSEVCKALARLSIIDKLRTAFVPALERGCEVPLMPQYGLAETGRTTCSGGTLKLGLNIQQMPRGNPKDKADPRNLVRECFVPRPGWHFVSVDYDTAELRALAHVCRSLFGVSKLGDDLDAGRDPHLAFAAQMLNLTYEETESRYNAGDPKVKEARQFGKIFNFGKPGGLGATTLVEFARTTYGTEMTKAQAEKLGNVWLKTYPEMKLFFKYIDRLGNKIVIPGYGMVRGDVTFTSACNSQFQGLVAAGARDALFDVAEECYVAISPLNGCRIVAFIHDEILLEVPGDPARGSAAAKRLAEVMCAAMSCRITSVKVTASPARMTRWIKEAKPVWDRDEVLRLWA